MNKGEMNLLSLISALALLATNHATVPDRQSDVMDNNESNELKFSTQENVENSNLLNENWNTATESEFSSRNDMGCKCGIASEGNDTTTSRIVNGYTRRRGDHGWS